MESELTTTPVPQLLLTLLPDGNVNIQIAHIQDRALLSRMLAQTIVAINQLGQDALPAKPKIIIPEVCVNGIRG